MTNPLFEILFRDFLKIFHIIKLRFHESINQTKLDTIRPVTKCKGMIYNTGTDTKPTSSSNSESNDITDTLRCHKLISVERFCENTTAREKYHEAVSVFSQYSNTGGSMEDVIQFCYSKDTLKENHGSLIAFI